MILIKLIKLARYLTKQQRQEDFVTVYFCPHLFYFWSHFSRAYVHVQRAEWSLVGSSSGLWFLVSGEKESYGSFPVDLVVSSR